MRTSSLAMGKRWCFTIIWQLSIILVVCVWERSVSRMHQYNSDSEQHISVSSGGGGVALLYFTFLQKDGKISAGPFQGAHYTFILGFLWDLLLLWLAERTAAAVNWLLLLLWQPWSLYELHSPVFWVGRFWKIHPSCASHQVAKQTIKGWGCGFPSSLLREGVDVCDCCSPCTMEQVEDLKEERVRGI